MRTSIPLVVAGLLLCGLAARPGAQTTLPGPPVPLTARVDGLTVTLNWTEPQEGRPIQFYILEMGTAPGVYEVTAPVGPITSLSFDAGEPGTLYFRASAVNALGQGPATPELAVTVGVASGPPSPPQNVTATVEGTEVTFSWAPPVSGAPITDYVARLGTAPGVYLGQGSVGLVTEVSITLPVGVYYFQVAARNAFGLGVPSDEIMVAVGTPDQLPGPPQNLAGDGSGPLVFSWSPPDEGAPILNYVLEIGTTSGEYLYVLTLGAVTSYSVPAPNGTYYFRVTAINALGQGPPSAEAAVRVGGLQTPSVPRNVTVTVNGSEFTATWDPPLFGAPFAGYEIAIGVEPGVYIYRSRLMSAGFSVTAPDGVYFFRVSAANTYGFGEPSDEIVFAVGTPTELPGPPRNLGAVAGFVDLTFTWSPPATGAPITNYLFEGGSASGDYSVSLLLGPVTSYRVSGAGVGSGTLFFRVTAINALGHGTPSDEAGINLSGPRTPSTPRNVAASTTAGAVSLSWSPPTFGGPITGYYVELGSAPGVYDIRAQVGPITSVPLPAWPDGLYYFRVTAINTYGFGPPSAEVAFYTGPPCTVPGPPQLTGSSTGNTIELSWTTPSGGPITGYSLLLQTEPGGPETVVATLGLVNLISGQVTNGTYLLRVRAHALCGVGARSNQVSVTVP